MPITQSMARAFCSAYNGAFAGQTIFVNSNGCVTVDEFQNPWVQIRKKEGDSLGSTEEAFDFLKKLESEAMTETNNTGAIMGREIISINNETFVRSIVNIEDYEQGDRWFGDAIRAHCDENDAIAIFEIAQNVEESDEVVLATARRLWDQGLIETVTVHLAVGVTDDGTWSCGVTVNEAQKVCDALAKHKMCAECPFNPTSSFYPGLEGWIQNLKQGFEEDGIPMDGTAAAPCHIIDAPTPTYRPEQMCVGHLALLRRQMCDDQASDKL